jgi:hypothetical protein
MMEWAPQPEQEQQAVVAILVGGVGSDSAAVERESRITAAA